MEAGLLLIAGVLGGVVNSVAGGGSFITFPALLFVGVPAVVANATNTFASCAGYMSGAYAFRNELSSIRERLPQIIIISLLGGAAGAFLLLHASEQQFRIAIPWLLLLATLLFIYGAGLNKALSRFRSRSNARTLSIGSAVLLLVCIYGGFFNAGLGIIILSYLVLAGYSDIHLMNGLKLVVSSVISLIAIVIFILGDLLAWYEGILVLLGNLTGGYIAAHWSRSIDQKLIRRAISVASILLTCYFFYDQYWL